MTGLVKTEEGLIEFEFEFTIFLVSLADFVTVPLLAYTAGHPEFLRIFQRPTTYRPFCSDRGSCEAVNL